MTKRGVNIEADPNPNCQAFSPALNLHTSGFSLKELKYVKRLTFARQRHLSLHPVFITSLS